MSFDRVMIIGGPGSGKTWLARHLGARYGLPVHAVDDAVWDENGTLKAPNDIDDRVRQVAARDRWIIKGEIAAPTPIAYGAPMRSFG